MKINFQKRFSIIIIAIIVGAIVLVSAGSYLGYTKFKFYQAKQAEKERQAQELIKSQQEALEEFKAEAQKEKEELVAKISDLQQQLNEEKSEPKNLSIQASELEPYLTGIVEVSCDGKSGSGFLWKNKSSYLMITNKHVVEFPYYNKDKGYYCFAKVNDIDGDDLAALYVHLSTYHTSLFLNNSADISALWLELIELPKGFTNTPIESLNYKLISLRKCPTSMPIGSPIVILGYPAFG